MKKAGLFKDYNASASRNLIEIIVRKLARGTKSKISHRRESTAAFQGCDYRTENLRVFSGFFDISIENGNADKPHALAN